MKKIALIMLLSAGIIGQAAAQKIIVNNNGTKWTITNDKDGSKIDIKGDVRLAADDRRIADISDNGSIKYSKNGDKLAIHQDKKGNLVYEFNGRVKEEFSAEEEDLLQGLIQNMIRNGIDAKGRTERIFAKSGTTGVLQEVDRLTGDYPRSVYLKNLLSLTNNPQDVEKIVNNLNQRINSDYYRTEVLTSAIKKASPNANLYKAYLEVVGSMESDYYKVEATKQLLNQDLMENQIASIIEMAKQMKSDYYQSELFKKLTDKHNIGESGFKNTLQLIASMNSDYYKAEVIKNLIKNNPKTIDWKALIGNTNQIESAYYQTEVLKQIIAKAPQAASLKEQLYESAKSIKSNHYQGEVLRAITAL